MLGAPFWILGLCFNFVIRAEGKMTTAAAMMSAGLPLNIALTPWFIYGLEWGVAGAAWATNIAMLAYTVIGYAYFALGKASFVADVHSLRWQSAVAKSDCGVWVHRIHHDGHEFSPSDCGI